MKLKLKNVQAQIELWKDQGLDAKSLQAAVDNLTAGKEIIDDDGKPVDYKFTASNAGESDAVWAKKIEDMQAEFKNALASINSKISDVPDRLVKGMQVTGGNARNDDEKTWGYKHMGEYLADVVEGSKKGGGIPERLKKAYEVSLKSAGISQKATATTYGNEFVGQDGGFAVPPDFRPEIISDQEDQPNIMAMTDKIRTGTNNLILPTDQNMPWENSTGVRVFWTQEAGAITQSKPLIKQITYQLNKLACLVPVTEELISDSSAMQSYVPRKAGEKMRYEVDRVIFRGTGAGQPLGFLNAPSLVTVAKESSQSAATVIIQNVVKMYATMYAPGINRAVWMIHPSVLPQLLTMTIGEQAAWSPPNASGFVNFTVPPAGFLLGRPVYVSQQCSVLGTPGDIVFCDFSQYLSLIKQDTATQAVSTDLWFDQDLMAFKYTFRQGGQPWRSEAITQANGTPKLGYFVALATRP
jgi:HK97 family phage major capsid protein